MAAPDVQHPMHAVIAPISAPAPKIDPMVAYESAQAAKPATRMSAEEPAAQPTRMSPLDQREAELQQGMAKKPEGFWGKLGHYAGMAGRIAGDVVAPGATELIVGNLAKEGIGPRANELRNKEIQSLETQKSEQALQGAQTAHAQQETAAGEPVEISPDQAQELEAPELAGTKVAPAVLATLYKQKGINAQKTDASQDRMTQQLRAHGYGH